MDRQVVIFWSNLKASESTMPEPLYISRSTIEKVGGLHRRARLETGVAVDFGVHGPIKEHYNLTDADDLPLPVDFLVAATGG